MAAHPLSPLGKMVVMQLAAILLTDLLMRLTIEHGH
jgi:hypothetical protein